MHAVVVEVEIQDDAAARKGLEDVVATVKQAPGLVAGYWIRLDERHGTSVVDLRDPRAGPRRQATGRRLRPGREDDERQRR